MLTADDEVDVISQLPPSVPANTQSSRLFLSLCLFQIQKFSKILSPSVYYFCLVLPANHTDILHPHQSWEREIHIPICNRSHFIFIHVILHKRVWVGKLVFLLSLQKKSEGFIRGRKQEEKQNQKTNTRALLLGNYASIATLTKLPLHRKTLKH